MRLSIFPKGAKVVGSIEREKWCKHGHGLSTVSLQFLEDGSWIVLYFTRLATSSIDSELYFECRITHQSV